MLTAWDKDTQRAFAGRHQSGEEELAFTAFRNRFVMLLTCHLLPIAC